ncbi:nucleotide-binding universal stress UspA family protein [Nocardioides ginsengisegetis]|uniref:Nucleotide-binding universal stress UspA family protein n=1 Tax=Nocardioides ginsengisegetis TaxID=661491 RepID=A0A7W3P9H6_9ACTN|nr:universal stress protein [Nocardioides ginsengisegetis]MBA8803459.1 nucleotide-binding universal stress UspA family protein [Nocardioides ginsengisegetis]
MNISPDTAPSASLRTSGTIVVGVDDTATSDRALAWAADQAALEHRGLTVLHATGVVPAGRGATDTSLRSGGHQVTRRAHRVLLDGAFAADVHEQAVPAAPVAALVDASAGAALVVVGSRGPGQLGTFVLGSVSRALVGKTRCPLVVVPDLHPERPDATGGVVVAVDDREGRRDTLDFAYRQAALRGLPLTILGCVLGSASESADDQRRRISEASAGFTDRYPDVVTTIDIDRGPVEEAVVRAGRGQALVVMGSHVHSWISRVVRGDPERDVVTHAPCPVAVVPSGSPDPAS